MMSDPALAVAVILGILMFFGFMRVIFYLARAMSAIVLRLLLRWSE